MSENDEEKGEYLTVRQALDYLAEKWGFESYSLEAFRTLRSRKKIKPDLSAENASFWKRETLDNIPKPDKSKPRPTRRKKTEQNEDHSEKAA